MLQLGRRFRATPHRNGTASSSGSYVRQLGRPFMVIAGDGLARVTDLGFQHRGRARATEDKGNRSCIGDRVWILPDGPASRGTSASKASKPDTEFHGVRHGVPRSRHYCASRRKPWHGPSSSARSAKSFYSVQLRALLRETPCRACLPCTQPGTLAASQSAKCDCPGRMLVRNGQNQPCLLDGSIPCPSQIEFARRQ